MFLVGHLKYPQKIGCRRWNDDKMWEYEFYTGWICKFMDDKSEGWEGYRM